jgi:predicted metal-dependent hydrolase
MDLPETETLSLPGGPARVEWRRNARARRISLRIDPRGGAVVITLPPRAGKKAGIALLRTHADWVANKLAALPEAMPFADGTCVPIGGIDHRIRHMPAHRGGAWLEDGELRVAGDPEFLRRRVTDFLRAEAARRLGAIAAEKSAMAGARARRIIVKDTRSRWGSCAPDGTIALCWRLIMAPDWVQDYVVAHEVAHLRHMNHGRHFWALVAELSPYTDRGIAWLRHDGARLLRIG